MIDPTRQLAIFSITSSFEGFRSRIGFFSLSRLISLYLSFPRD